MLYPILKWLHVLSAIVALGANLTYGLWITRARPSLGTTLMLAASTPRMPAQASRTMKCRFTA